MNWIDRQIVNEISRERDILLEMLQVLDRIMKQERPNLVTILGAITECQSTLWLRATSTVPHGWWLEKKDGFWLMGKDHDKTHTFRKRINPADITKDILMLATMARWQDEVLDPFLANMGPRVETPH